MTGLRNELRQTDDNCQRGQTALDQRRIAGECLFLVPFARQAWAPIPVGRSKMPPPVEPTFVPPANRKDQAAKRGKLSFNKYPSANNGLFAEGIADSRKTLLLL
jgi:hypothetical protein